jgi:hypothetical protein
MQALLGYYENVKNLFGLGSNKNIPPFMKTYNQPVLVNPVGIQTDPYTVLNVFRSADNILSARECRRVYTDAIERDFTSHEKYIMFRYTYGSGTINRFLRGQLDLNTDDGWQTASVWCNDFLRAKREFMPRLRLRPGVIDQEFETRFDETYGCLLDGIRIKHGGARFNRNEKQRMVRFILTYGLELQSVIMKAPRLPRNVNAGRASGFVSVINDTNRIYQQAFMSVSFNTTMDKIGANFLPDYQTRNCCYYNVFANAGTPAIYIPYQYHHYQPDWIAQLRREEIGNVVDAELNAREDELIFAFGTVLNKSMQKRQQYMINGPGNPPQSIGTYDFTVEGVPTNVNRIYLTMNGVDENVPNINGFYTCTVTYNGNRFRTRLETTMRMECNSRIFNDYTIIGGNLNVNVQPNVVIAPIRFAQTLPPIQIQTAPVLNQPVDLIHQAPPVQIVPAPQIDATIPVSDNFFTERSHAVYRDYVEYVQRLGDINILTEEQLSDTIQNLTNVIYQLTAPTDVLAVQYLNFIIQNISKFVANQKLAFYINSIRTIIIETNTVATAHQYLFQSEKNYINSQPQPNDYEKLLALYRALEVATQIRTNFIKFNTSNCTYYR